MRDKIKELWNYANHESRSAYEMMKFTLLLFVLLFGNDALMVYGTPKVSKQIGENVSVCRLKSSCNPLDVNPCGCLEACCAPDIGLQDNYEGHSLSGALPFLYGYRCYKKPKFGMICSNDGLCPCHNNLRCIKSFSSSKFTRCY